MSACSKDLFDVIFFLESSADNALTTAVLSLEGIDRQTLDVAFAAERNHLFFFGNQVFVIVVIDRVFDNPLLFSGFPRGIALTRPSGTTDSRPDWFSRTRSAGQSRRHPGRPA